MKMKLGKNRDTPDVIKSVQQSTGLTKKPQMNTPEELHKEFKLACLQDDRDMTEITIFLIRNWLDERKDDFLIP